MLPDSASDLQNKIYKSDEACAAFLFPFKNYVFDPLIVKSQADQLSDDMTELMKNVVNHTPRPDYIKASGFKRFSSICINKYAKNHSTACCHNVYWRSYLQRWFYCDSLEIR